ncbi:DUF262 domain-containing protein [Enterococcus casseliflavus]|uniref:DUF262 domain-containing protein n=1 Tax=Enterococcus casseliflavus TaxID=37734 RepID=UPI001642F605|nr:DUF262 domain-containing protein [Enterococcus casseliflavus]
MSEIKDEYLKPSVEQDHYEGDEDIKDLTELTDEQLKEYDHREDLKKKWLSSSSTELKKEINITRESYSLYDLFRKYNGFLDGESEGTIILEPEFQREFVWSTKKKQELVESVLLGIPLPAFYLSEDINGNLIVVDGKQRLSTLFEFMTKGLNLGENLKHLVNNKRKATHEDLEPKIRRKLEDFQLLCFVVSSTTPPLVQNEIFLRVNRGGVTLNQQEVRNALNIGKSTKLLNKISADSDIIIVSKKRKKDQYLTLRFFAFYLWKMDASFIDHFDFDKDFNNISDFLDSVMKYLNYSTDDFIENLSVMFKKSYEKSMLIFSGLSRVPFTRATSSVVNMNIFEIWMYLMTILDFDSSDHNMIEFLQTAYEEMVEDEDFNDKILFLRDQKERIEYRFEYVEKIASEVKKLA